MTLFGAAAAAQAENAPSVQELETVAALDAYVKERLDGWLLSEEVSDDEVLELLERYATLAAEGTAEAPGRLWLVQWSHGKRLLLAGDGAGAFEVFEQVRRHAAEKTRENAAFAPYLWYIFEDQAALVQSGLGDVSFEELAEQCYAVFPADDPAHPVLLQILVDERVRRERFSEAHELLGDARERYTTAEEQPVEIVAYLTAYVHLAEGRPHLAVGLAQSAFDFFWARPEAGSPPAPSPFAQPSLEVLVDAWTSLGAHAQVVATLGACLEDHGGLLEGLDTSRLRLALAVSLLEEGEPEEAGRIMEGLCAQPELPDALFVQAKSRLADLALRARDPKGALEHIEEALPRRVESELTIEELALPLALGMRALRRSGDPTAGLGRFLPELRERFEQLLQLWQSQDLVDGGLGLLCHVAERTAISEVLIGVGQTQGAAAAFEVLVRVEATSTLARRLGGGTSDLAGVRVAMLRDGGGVVDFFYDDDVLHVFAVGKEALAYETVEEVAGLSQACSRYQGLVARPPGALDPGERRARWLREGQRLAQLLYPAPIRAALSQWSRVCLVSTEILGGSFALATLPVLTDAPLGVDRAVTYLPSISAGLALARLPDDGEYELDLVFLTNAKETSGTRLLSMSDPEQAALLQPFAAKRVLTLTEQQANLPQLQAAVPRTKVLHMFAHGVYESGRPVPASVAIASSEAHDGALGADELLALDPLPPLVILSVCGAASGPPRLGGEGSSDLRGVCLRAGARNLIAATGEVNQVATHRLMVYVHRALANGDDPARALQAAWAELRHVEGGRFDDPYYFGQIQVMGLAERALF